MKKKERSKNPYKVESGVHFVWVPTHKGFQEHWLSFSHTFTVGVFAPNENRKEWSVILFMPGVVPINNNRNEFLDTFESTRKAVWRKAVQWAKYGLSKRRSR